MPKFSAYLRGAQGPSGRSIFNGSYSTTTEISNPQEGAYIIGNDDPKAVWVYNSNGNWVFEGYYGHKLSVLNVSTSTVSYNSNANVSINLIKDETGTDDSLNFHFDIPSMQNGGTINGPLLLANSISVGTTTNQVATAKFVRKRGLYHVTLANIGPNTTEKTHTVYGITETMRIVNCILSDPNNIIGNISWQTDDDEITINGNFVGNTNIDLDLIETSENLTETL